MHDQAIQLGRSALDAGRWTEARAAFESALDTTENSDARFGLASALWWLGDSRIAVREAATAYALFRKADDVPGAIRSAVWLTFTYKADFANYAVSNGWMSRAERLITGLDRGGPQGGRPVQPGDADDALGWEPQPLAYPLLHQRHRRPPTSWSNASSRQIGSRRVMLCLGVGAHGVTPGWWFSLALALVLVLSLRRESS